MTKTTSTNPRETLAHAIADEHVARQNLDDAKAAADKARSHAWAAENACDDLRKQLEEPPDADALISQIAGGADVVELSRPRADLRERIEAAEEHADTWRKSRAVAEQSIPIREDALGWSQSRVVAAISDVISSETDIGKLIAACEQQQAAVMRSRANLLGLQKTLTHGSAERKSLEQFLARAWVADVTGMPEAQAWGAAFAALRSDPNAALPPS